MIRTLPDDGAVSASLQGGYQFRGWGADRHLLANQFDAFIAANSKGKPKEKSLTPRPKKAGAAGGGRRLADMAPKLPRRPSGG